MESEKDFHNQDMPGHVEYKPQYNLQDFLDKSTWTNKELWEAATEIHVSGYLAQVVLQAARNRMAKERAQE